MANQDFESRAYDQLCQSYRAIDDFRAKLLGFLPLATGAGILVLLKEAPNAWNKGPGVEGAPALVAVGVFGALVTLGLFSYEIYGIKKCAALIYHGGRIEALLNVDNGQFTKRPNNVAWVINEPFAAGVIYPGVLAAWMFFALNFEWPKANPTAPVLVFIVGFVGTLIYAEVLRREYRAPKQDRAKLT